MNEYLSKLRRRVAQNNRFNVINKPITVAQRTENNKYKVVYKPGARVMLKTNAANIANAKAARNKGYTTTNLRIKNAEVKHTVYKKNSNGQMYAKFESPYGPKNYQKLPLNMVVRKSNGTLATVGSLDPNNNYNNLNIGTYVNIVPINNKSVYLHYGHTAGSKRQMGYGTLLRKFAMNAAKNAGMKLYQVSLNVERLLRENNKNRTPYSGRIMKKLGARPVAFKNVPASIRPGHSTNMWFVYN